VLWLSESQVRDYVLSPEELKEIWAKYGKPGEIAPGTKASKKRNNRIQMTDQETEKDS